jgi:hypothetical protein
MAADVADCVRSCIVDCLGIYNYDLHVVQTRWSGRIRGQGIESVTSDVKITPVPKIMLDLSFQLDMEGRTEAGSAECEVSIHVKQATLIPDTAVNESFFWEIVDRSNGERMRFFPDKKPVRNPGETTYKLSAHRIFEDRKEDGTIDDSPVFMPRAK